MKHDSNFLIGETQESEQTSSNQENQWRNWEKDSLMPSPGLYSLSFSHLLAKTVTNFVSILPPRYPYTNEFSKSRLMLLKCTYGISSWFGDISR